MNVVGVGYTIYLGSEYESADDDRGGPADRRRARGRAHRGALDVSARQGGREREGRPPHRRRGGRCRLPRRGLRQGEPAQGRRRESSAEMLKEASAAAGRTGLVCAGGSTVDAKTFLTQLWEQIHVGGASGNATGRNIHQRELDEAVRLTKAISRHHARRLRRRARAQGVRGRRGLHASRTALHARTDVFEYERGTVREEPDGAAVSHKRT